MSQTKHSSKYKCYYLGSLIKFPQNRHSEEAKTALLEVSPLWNSEQIAATATEIITIVFTNNLVVK